jgi:SPP1 gp7 family putative phage head morphogenesis protein
MLNKYIPQVDFSARGRIMKRRRLSGKTGKFKKAPVWRYPTSIELQYQIFLQRLVKKMQVMTVEKLIPHLPLLVGEADRERKMDAWGESLDELMEALKIGFDEVTDDDATINFVRHIARRTSNWNGDQFHHMVRTVVGVEQYAYEPWLESHLKSFVSENIGLITKLKEETYHDINRIVESGLRKGDSYRDISKSILNGSDLETGRFDKTKTRATLIARDQIGKFNGELTSIRQKSIGIDEYYWRTAGDERVRESHDALNGMLCKWDDDTVCSDDDGETWQSRSSIGGYEGKPGEDFQCRCWAEAKLVEPNVEEEEEE